MVIDKNKIYEMLFGQRGRSPETVIQNTFGIPTESISERVLLSPGWIPDRLFPADEIRELCAASPLFGYHIWEICHRGVRFTYIKTGFGAPVNLDAVLLLGLTACRTIIFISSVGSLSSEMTIGDLLLPEYAVSGDGAVRYLSEDVVSDPFGSECRPDKCLSLRLWEAAETECNRAGVRLHQGRLFCSDTIVAEGTVFDFAKARGADAMDMESAAVFRAAETAGIRSAALLQVSDAPQSDKTLFHDRGNEADRQYRRFVQRETMPRIIVGVLGGGFPITGMGED